VAGRPEKIRSAGRGGRSVHPLIAEDERNSPLLAWSPSKRNKKGRPKDGGTGRRLARRRERFRLRKEGKGVSKGEERGKKKKAEDEKKKSILDVASDTPQTRRERTRSAPSSKMDLRKGLNCTGV